jgi:hypothetical protein
MLSKIQVEFRNEKDRVVHVVSVDTVTDHLNNA